MKPILTFYMSALIFILAILSCTPKAKDTTRPSAKTQEFINIGVQEALQIHKLKNETIFLDVRTPDETDLGIIEGAQLLNFRDDDFEEKLKNFDKDLTYVVYCKSGSRSSRAAKMMIQQGFNHVINLDGGYTAWAKLIH